MMRVMSSVGSPTEVSTITIVTRPAWGMPAAPILAAVAVILDCRVTNTHTYTGDNAWDFLCIFFIDKRISLNLYFLFLYIYHDYYLFCYFLPDGDYLTKVHLHIVDLGNENGCQCLIQSCSIHVDSGTDRQHESCDSLVNFVVLFQTFKGDGEGGWAGTWKK